LKKQSNATMGEEKRRDWQQQSLRLGLVSDCHAAVAPLTVLPGPQRMLKCSGLMNERVRH